MLSSGMRRTVAIQQRGALGEIVKDLPHRHFAVKEISSFLSSFIYRLILNETLDQDRVALRGG